MTEHTDYLFYNARITLLEEIARRIGISNKELVMLSLEEIEDIIKNYYEMSEEYLSILMEMLYDFYTESEIKKVYLDNVRLDSYETMLRNGE